VYWFQPRYDNGDGKRALGRGYPLGAARAADPQGEGAAGDSHKKNSERRIDLDSTMSLRWNLLGEEHISGFP